MERLDHDLLVRWFAGLGFDDAAWDHSAFSKNRDRLVDGDITAEFLAAFVAQPKVKSFKPRDGAGDPVARLYRKGAGKEAKLCFLGHALMENRSGSVVGACLTRADGHGSVWRPWC